MKHFAIKIGASDDIESKAEAEDEGVVLEELEVIDPNSEFNTLSTDSEWAVHGTQFHASTRADKTKRLPPGVYRFNAMPGAWWLERTSSRFEFPFKVYNAGAEIVDRIVRFWKGNKGNLGILMNGTRGAGKTMQTQILGNRMIDEEEIPILVVRHPVPLQIIFDAVQQDMMVIFDEFEKTHEDKQQQQLLSTIDGMSRSAHRRLIVFTTNSTKINENFRDRPSRIHYRFEFTRVADEIIDGLVDDSLPQDLMHLKPDIFEFLNSRKICTIDIVKAVIAETTTFRESPLQFEDLLNVAKGEPPSYTVEILNKDGLAIGTFAHFFQLNQNSARHAALLGGNARSIQDFMDRGNEVHVRSTTWDGDCLISLLEKCEEDNVWLAKLCAPRSKTIFKDFDFLGNYTLWYDNEPDDFRFPYTRENVRGDDKAREEVIDLWHNATNNGSVHGTGTPAVFKVRITPNKEYKTPSRYRQTADDKYGGWD